MTDTINVFVSQSQPPVKVTVSDPNDEQIFVMVSDVAAGAMKLDYYEKYIATGTEGTVLTTGGDSPMIPVLNGKMILLVTRESSPLYPVSDMPDSAEYTWDNNNVVLGNMTNPGERFLFLYRTY